MLSQQSRPATAAGPPTTSPPPETLPPAWAAVAGEPQWLWESLRHQFWQPPDLDRTIRHAGPLTPEQRETLAAWWSLLATVAGLGPRAYAAAFVRATEQHDSDQVRWSLLAMLRDELHHEQLCNRALVHLVPGWPRPHQPQTTLGRHAHQHLDQVHHEAERCWHGYQHALTQQPIGVVTGGLLLRGLATGGLYQRWAAGCATPALATALRHAAHDAQRHQAVLRALAARDWPLLSAPQRSQAAAQVQATARFLSAVMLDPAAGRPDPPDDPAANQHARQADRQAACQAGLGVPTAGQRQELLRAALLQVRGLQHRYHIPFPAMPHLAIPGTQGDSLSPS
jgi:hypothetical protein